MDEEDRAALLRGWVEDLYDPRNLASFIKTRGPDIQ